MAELLGGSNGFHPDRDARRNKRYFPRKTVEGGKR